MTKNNQEAPTLTRHQIWMHRKRQAVPYLLLAPVLIFVCLFMLWPIINVFKMSFESYYATKPNAREFIGFENFITIFTKDELFLKTLGNTAVYVLVSVAIQTVLGFWLAYLLTRKFKGRGIVRALALVPWAVAGVMVGIIQTNMSWFSDSRLAMTGAIIANVWRGIPFFTISYMSALSSISDDLYESAKIDGASAPVTMFRITIPMIKDTIILTTLLRAIWTFNAVDLIISLTDGGPNRGTTTLALYIMRTFSNDFNYGYASALAAISTLLMMIVAFFYIRFGKLGKDGIV